MLTRLGVGSFSFFFVAALTLTAAFSRKISPTAAIVLMDLNRKKNLVVSSQKKEEEEEERLERTTPQVCEEWRDHAKVLPSTRYCSAVFSPDA